MTQIISNGSKWTGEAPDPISKLEEVLAEHTLDPRFEDYGDFCTYEEKKWDFFGNFIDISHVFHIRTDDPILASRLKRLIDSNKKSPGYANAQMGRAVEIPVIRHA